MENTPESQNKQPKPPVSRLDLIVAWLTIIASISQVIDLGLQIHQYLDQQQPQSVEIIQQSKKNS
ncbi:hypothetical protein [Limnofasciculus baicalensis]|uniref:Uncharacterized protein n=1 Tax=Limnofasciculus baicalensis BBK-W-15 TaxID=2699891 RepID=A0AAE3GUM5_9CYAN|nr:hypothetical protein [Limnofasciculus baicalensis]MCP2730083.1 hypothetical protein [Limnofasciculus baicalensis BBK-W-15]